jgi:hypothetical protein
MITLQITCWHCNQLFFVNVEESDYDFWRERLGLAQDIFHYLSDGERELIISRTCDTCFDELFPQDEDEDEDE